MQIVTWNMLFKVDLREYLCKVIQYLSTKKHPTLE